jgi:hypothetical protein
LGSDPRASSLSSPSLAHHHSDSGYLSPSLGGAAERTSSTRQLNSSMSVPPKEGEVFEPVFEDEDPIPEFNTLALQLYVATDLPTDRRDQPHNPERSSRHQKSDSGKTRTEPHSRPEISSRHQNSDSGTPRTQPRAPRQQHKKPSMRTSRASRPA